MFSTDLGEIPNQVAASVVSLGHDVEEEGFNIVIKGFVVQEKLCQQTQVLTVDLGTKKKRCRCLLQWDIPNAAKTTRERTKKI